MIAKAMRAILLASATATSLKGLVCMSFFAQEEIVDRDHEVNAVAITLQVHGRGIHIALDVRGTHRAARIECRVYEVVLPPWIRRLDRSHRQPRSAEPSRPELPFRRGIFIIQNISNICNCTVIDETQYKAPSYFSLNTADCPTNGTTKPELVVIVRSLFGDHYRLPL